MEAKYNPICSLDGCDESRYATGLCHFHYFRKYKYGDPLFIPAKSKREVKDRRCSVEGCDNKPQAQRLCPKHRARFKKYGDVYTIGTSGKPPTPIEERFWVCVKRGAEDECWEWQGFINPGGYGQTFFQRKNIVAHRVSFYLAHGYLPENFVLHSCDNRSCVNPAHLREGTQRDNMNDKVERDRQQKGEQVNTAKLTATDVLEIRRRVAEGEVKASIAREFKVSAANIGYIVYHNSWKHLK